NVGYFATIFLAGLQGIDIQYYEAARIDGAGPWACFWSITLPLLRPPVLFVVVMSVILSFQVFALVYVMTAGGPAGSTSVIVFYLYQQAFTYFRMGYASAVGYVLFGIIFVLTLLHLKFLCKHARAGCATASAPSHRRHCCNTACCWLPSPSPSCPTSG